MTKNTDDIISLTLAVDELTKEVREEKHARRQTVKAVRVGATAVIAAVIVISVALAFLRNDAENEKASRAEARVSSCEQYNDGVVAQFNNALLGIADDVGYERDRLTGRLLPARDCSAAGIDAYFDDDESTDPYVKETS